MKEYIPRIKTEYQSKVVPELMKKFQFKNIHQVPRLKKIVINVGLNEAKENVKVLEMATAEIATITGQRPQVRRAKQAVSNFKLRKGMPIGIKVTLRGVMMYEFFDRLVNVAVPRMRDFRGLEPKFDGQGNYNLGLNEQYIFPEIKAEKSDRARGMNITIVTSAKTNEHARELLSLLGTPFKKR